MNPGKALQALRKTRTIECVVCGKKKETRDSRTIYCSNRCKQAAKRKKP